jgi:hypothetical protein
MCTHDGKSLYTLHFTSIRSINLNSFHSSIQIDKKGFARTIPRCGSGRATAVGEVEAGVDNDSGDRRSRERLEFREFWDKKRNDTGRTTISMFKNISSGYGLKPLLIVLESRPKRFWFKTAADEGIISSSSKLEPLLIS